MDPRTRVADVMTRTVVTTTPNARLEEAARLLREHHVSGLPVVTPPHRVVGLLSERDIVRSLDRATGVDSPRGLLDLLLDSAPAKGESVLEVCRRQLRNARVADAMSPHVVTVDRDAPLLEAAQLLRVHGVKRLPVVDARGALVGIVSRADVVQAVSGEVRAPRGALHPGPAGAAAVRAGPFEDV
jgi:CBS-domain-containing membrane protein